MKRDTSIRRQRSSRRPSPRTATRRKLTTSSGSWPTMGRDGESGFPLAIPEFRAELKINPDDYRSHYLLGYILLKQRNLKEAENELTRAAALEPQNPDPLIYLGQLYADT